MALGWRRAPARAPWAAILAAMLTLSCSGNPYPGWRQLPASSVHSIPLGPMNQQNSWVKDLDAALGRDGRLHVVWVAGDLSYSVSKAAPSQWSPVTRVRSTVDGARLVVTDSSLHAFLGWPDLRHLAAPQGGEGWQDLGPVTRDSEWVISYDALAAGGRIVVAYLAFSSPDSVPRTVAKPAKLVIAEIPEDGAITHQDLATFADVDRGSTPGPRLATWRGEVHVVCAAGNRYVARAVAAYQETPGGPWHSAGNTFPVGAAERLLGLTMAATRDRLFLFFARSADIEGSESRDGRQWSAPVRLVHPSGGFWSGTPVALGDLQGEDGRNLVASADSDAVVLAWLDRALGEHEQPPIGMYNYYSSFNLLALATTARPATLANLAASPILRITPAHQFPRAVAARSGGGQHQLVWTVTPHAPNFSRIPVVVRDSTSIETASLPEPAS